MHTADDKIVGSAGMFRAFRNPRLRTDLLGPEEKAEIIAAMRALDRPLETWVGQFRRLPATIQKIAAEAGIKVYKWHEFRRLAEAKASVP